MKITYYVIKTNFNKIFNNYNYYSEYIKTEAEVLL